MDEYIVEDIVVTLTKDEYNKIIEAILCLDNEGYNVPDTLYDKFYMTTGKNTVNGFLQDVDDDTHGTFILTTDQPQGD